MCESYIATCLNHIFPHVRVIYCHMYESLHNRKRRKRRKDVRRKDEHREPVKLSGLSVTRNPDVTIRITPAAVYRHTCHWPRPGVPASCPLPADIACRGLGSDYPVFTTGVRLSRLKSVVSPIASFTRQLSHTPYGG